MMSVLINEEDLPKIDSNINFLSTFLSENSLTPSIIDEAISVIDWLNDIKFILTFKPDFSDIVN
jgi:hypothetical protein